MDEKKKQDSYRAQVYSRLNERETEDLVVIWQENDREAWTDTALDVIQEILLERLGELPEQGIVGGANEEAINYPTDKKLIWIADSSRILSWIFLVVASFNFIVKLFNYLGNFFPLPIEQANYTGLFIYLINEVWGWLFAGFSFFVLQAMKEIIYLLMDIREIIQPQEIAENEISDESIESES